MNSIKFMTNKKEYILAVPQPIGESCCECDATSNVYFVNEEKGINILLGGIDSRAFHGDFGYNNISEKLLNKELFFDTEKRIDPGFESEQFLEERIKNTDVISKYYFVGKVYFDTSPCYSSWFYNDKDGNIIFEISPSYPWKTLSDEERVADPNFIPYSEWIKNYKVVVRRIIPRETLIQWNEQTKNYTHVFEKLDHLT